MSETVVIVPSAPSAPSVPSAPSAPSAPSPDIVEVIHDDARDLGYALAQIQTLDSRVTAIETQVGILSANADAQVQATNTVASVVEDIAEAVEEMEPGDQVESVPEPEPDTPPGKPHWLRRSGKDWWS